MQKAFISLGMEAVKRSFDCWWLSGKGRIHGLKPFMKVPHK